MGAETLACQHRANSEGQRQAVLLPRQWAVEGGTVEGRRRELGASLAGGVFHACVAVGFSHEWTIDVSPMYPE